MGKVIKMNKMKKFKIKIKTKIILRLHIFYFRLSSFK